MALQSHRGLTATPVWWLVPLLVGALGAAAPGHASPHRIPPGHDALLAELLGAGTPLPDDCVFAGGSVEAAFVTGRYTCATAPEVRLELRHPDDAPPGAVRTARFAILPQGPAPPALVSAIQQRLAAGETRFHWAAAPVAMAPAAPPPRPPPPNDDPATVSGWRAVLFFVLTLTAPLVVVLGVLGAYAWALLPAARRAAGEAGQRRRLASYLGVFGLVLAMGALSVIPHWSMQIDEERDLILTALCARDGECPLVGNEMSQLRVKLGPLNRYLMTLTHLVTPDPRFCLGLILALHALAAAWLAAAGSQLLGWPLGLIAGVLFGINPPLLDTLVGASNGAWSSFFIVGGIVGTLHWIAGRPSGLILAVTCLTAASQFHGTNLALAPALGVVALWWRPRTPWWALFASAAVAVSLYSPWLLYQFLTRGSDFSAFSATWMVSQGPNILERLVRLVPYLGGPLIVPCVIAGAIALATGRDAPAGRGPAGHAVLLFLAVPVTGTLLAGAGWASRYGVPMVAPAALVAAAGVPILAEWLLRRRDAHPASGGRRMALLALAVAALLASALRPSLPDAGGPTGVPLGISEQIEAIRAIGERGFDATDLETRVHGLTWDRWNGGQIYLGHWLLGAGNGSEDAAAAEIHVAIVECDHATAVTAAWEHPLASARFAPLRLVGYRPALRPVRVDFLRGPEVVWSGTRAVPFYGQLAHIGDSRLRARLHPALAHPAEFDTLSPIWRRTAPNRMRLRTTLAAGSNPSFLTLLYDQGLSATLTVGGTVRRPIAAMSGARTSYERFRIAAAERSDELAVEVVIDLPPASAEPVRVDLFEEPACEAAAAGQIE